MCPLIAVQLDRLPSTGIPARLFNKPSSVPAACPITDDLYSRRLKVYRLSFILHVMFHSHQGLTLTPVVGAKHYDDMNFKLPRLRQVILGSGTPGPATFIPRSAVYCCLRFLKPNAWVCKCPYLDGLPTRISPRSVVVGRHTMPFLSFKSLHALQVHVVILALNAGRCGASERGSKNGNGWKSGVNFVGSSIDRCATNRQPPSWNQKLHRHLFQPA